MYFLYPYDLRYILDLILLIPFWIPSYFEFTAEDVGRECQLSAINFFHPRKVLTTFEFGLHSVRWLYLHLVNPFELNGQHF
jgi:hypothetical protein